MNVADQLRNAIRESGQSVKSVAEAVEMPTPVLHRFVTGERDIRLETFSRLCELFSMRLTKPTKPKGLRPDGRKHGTGDE